MENSCSIVISTALTRDAGGSGAAHTATRTTNSQFKCGDHSCLTKLTTRNDGGWVLRHAAVACRGRKEDLKPQRQHARHKQHTVKGQRWRENNIAQ